jgi:hypothetical protein
MKIYCVVVEDQHCDVGIEVFSNKREALQYALKFVNSMIREGEDRCEVMPENDNSDDEIVARVCYSCEGDSVTVMQKIVHK